MPEAPEKLSGNVTLSTFSPALITFVKARIEDGATNRELMQEFGISNGTVTAIRKTSMFNRAHVNALKKGLPDAFSSVVASALSSIDPVKLQACSAPQLMMVAGIAYDKLRLASGESTANVSFRDAGTSAIQKGELIEGMLKSIVAGLDIPELPAKSD